MADIKRTVVEKGEGFETVEVTGSQVEEFMGSPVKPSIDYTFRYKRYADVAHAKASEDWPNDSDMLKFVNQSAERSAKAQEYQKAIKNLKEAYENSIDFKVSQLVKAAVAAKMPQAQAEALGEQTRQALLAEEKGA